VAPKAQRPTPKAQRARARGRYAYYGLAAVGVQLPPLLKRAVTSVQISQFISCIPHAIAALLLDSTPVVYNVVQVLYHIMMLRLFLPLLLRRPPKLADGHKAVEVPPTPAEEAAMGPPPAGTKARVKKVN
jgi:hypothetical protein